MPRTFEEMFKDYDQELAKIESERVANNKTAQQNGNAQRESLAAEIQANPNNEDLKSLNQWKIEASEVGENDQINKNNENAEEKRKGVEADRAANQQERIAGTGLNLDQGQAPEQGKPANENWVQSQPYNVSANFAEMPAPGPVEIPLDKNAVERKAEQPQGDPQQQPQAQAESDKKGGILQSVGDAIRETKADVALQVAGVGIAAITNLHAALANQNYADSHPPTNQTEFSVPAPENTDAVKLPKGAQPLRGGKEAPQTTTEAAPKQPEERVVTNVYGIEVKPPPPPPPPPANDNAPGLTK